MQPLRIGLIGFGHVARARHIPAIAGDNRFALVAIANNMPVETLVEVPIYNDHDELLADPNVDAVAICTPPAVRADIALAALAAGKHALLEKPPCATMDELELLDKVAAERGLTLFTAWHSQHNTAVEVARELLATRRVSHLVATWHEDVERTHPGQHWIFQPKGFGVFDAGSNALSILTRILPNRIAVTDANFVVRSGDAMPIAARVSFRIDDSDDNVADLDWRVRHDSRNIAVRCEDGTELSLSRSGRHLHVNGAPLVEDANSEYPRLYSHFFRVVANHDRDVDDRPLQLIVDAFHAAKNLG
jgi:predicted dehydrogenase